LHLELAAVAAQNTKTMQTVFNKLNFSKLLSALAVAFVRKNLIS